MPHLLGAAAADVGLVLGDKSCSHVRLIIDHQLPSGGKVGHLLTGGQADDKIRSGMEQADQTLKRKLEGC